MTHKNSSFLYACEEGLWDSGATLEHEVGLETGKHTVVPDAVGTVKHSEQRVRTSRVVRESSDGFSEEDEAPCCASPVLRRRVRHCDTGSVSTARKVSLSCTADSHAPAAAGRDPSDHLGYMSARTWVEPCSPNSTFTEQRSAALLHSMQRWLSYSLHRLVHNIATWGYYLMAAFLAPTRLIAYFRDVHIIQCEADAFERSDSLVMSDEAESYEPSRRKRITSSAGEATKKLRQRVTTGVRTAKKYVQPFMLVETDMDNHSDSYDDLHSLTLSEGRERERVKRILTNTHIRNYLRDVPQEQLYNTFRVHLGTWNVDQTSPPPYSVGVLEWLLGPSLASAVDAYHQQKKNLEEGCPCHTSRECTASDSCAPDLPLDQFPDLLVISLQEVEMGGMALVKEFTQSSVVWAEAIMDTLRTASGQRISYKKVRLVQLVGLVVIMLVQEKHVEYISHIRISLTRTGAMRMLGNKGSVGVRATVYGKRFLFVAAHFAAHKHNERRRTYNYRAAVNDLRFELPASPDDECEVLKTFADAQAACSALDASSIIRNPWSRLLRRSGGHVSVETESRMLDQHDYIFFLGDLNSRLHHVSSGEIRRMVTKGEYDALLCRDELRQGMVSGEVFNGFQEAFIAFPPTYKFDKGTEVYDTSRKNRDPAWCDRVLFRLLREQDTALEEESVNKEKSAPYSHEDLPTEQIPPHENDYEVEPLAHQECHPSPSYSSSYTTESTGCTHSTMSPSGQLLASIPVVAVSPASGENGTPQGDTEEHVSSRRHDTSSQHFNGASVMPRDARQTQSSSPPASGDPQTFRAARQPCDRRHLDVRFPMIPNEIGVLGYHSVSVLRQSDHRPVSAQFNVRVVSLSPTLVQNMLQEVHRLLPDAPLEYSQSIIAPSSGVSVEAAPHQ